MNTVHSNTQLRQKEGTPAAIWLLGHPIRISVFYFMRIDTDPLIPGLYISGLIPINTEMVT